MAKVYGPWIEPNYRSGLLAQCRDAWERPFAELSNTEVATFLGQKLAVEQLIPVAKKRVEEQYDDDSELYDGELLDALREAEYWRSVQFTSANEALFVVANGQGGVGSILFKKEKGNWTAFMKGY